MRQLMWALGAATALAAGCAGFASRQAPSYGDLLPLAPAEAAGAGIDLTALDTTVNACENFYQHACGGFINSVELTPARSSVSLSEEKFDASVEKGLAALLAVKAPAGSELERVSTFYQSCLGDERVSISRTRRLLEQIDAARTPRDIQDLILALSAIGVNPFFAYAGTPDPKNLMRYRGEIDHSNLWQEPAVVERVFVLAGIPVAQARADALAVGAITKELRAYRAQGGAQGDYENPATLADLERDAPAIDWRRFFKLVGASPDRPLNLTSDRYLPAVSRAISTRSVSELRAYLRWNFLLSLRGELPAPFNQAFGDITPSLRVALDQPGRRCRDATTRAMGVEFSRQYAQRILGMEAREAAYKIGASIQLRIVEAVDDADWLSPAARRATADKLRMTDLKLGFPDHWPEVGSFGLDPSDFLGNVLAARRYEQKRAWRRANETRSRKNWDMLVYPWVGKGMAAARLTIPNGFPDQNTNSMVMTAAILNAPFFDKNAPLEINYGGFGFTFAHEFVHIAETHDYGSLGQPQELWSAADIESAANRTQCVIDQAEASAAPPGSRISGKANYSENVADLGGIRLAYAALAARLGDQVNRPDKAGMTPAKRFFYKYAQTYCTAATPATLGQLVAHDPHGLPSYRVNGPLSNLPAFGETFGCRAGTPMRRSADKICKVW